MKENRSTRRIRNASIVALAAITVMALAATPALADDGPLVIETLGIEWAEIIPLVGQFQVEPVIEPIGDGGGWEMCPTDETPSFPDGGADEVCPQEPVPDGGNQETPPDTPDDGGDEPGDEPDNPDDGGDEPGDEPDTPDDGGDEPGDEPDNPDDGGDEPGDEPEDKPSDSGPSLPFTGGDSGRFAVAGIFVLLAGMLVLARGYALRRS